MAAGGEGPAASSGGGAPLQGLTLQLLPASQFPSDNLSAQTGFPQQRGPAASLQVGGVQIPSVRAQNYPEEVPPHPSAAAVAASNREIMHAAETLVTAGHAEAAAAVAEAQADSRDAHYRVRELEVDVADLMEQNK